MSKSYSSKMATFQGCFKDGTEPTCRDCRWFSVIPFLLQLIIFITYSLLFFAYTFYAGILAIILVLASILTIIVEPYKPQFRHYSDHFTVFLLIFSCLVVCAEGMDYYTLGHSKLIYPVFSLTELVHIVYLLVLVFYWLKKKYNCL